MGTTVGRWEEDVACHQRHRALNEELARGALNRWMFEGGCEKGFRQDGTRSCVQKGQWSPQAWIDQIRSECVGGSKEERRKKRKAEEKNRSCTRLQEPPWSKEGKD